MPMFPSALIPQVAERGSSPQLDNVDRSNTHGESIIKAVKGAGELAAKVAFEEKAKADTASIVQAESDYMASLNAAQTELHQYKGALLEDRDQQALKNVEEVRTKILKGLKNETQRSEFEKRSLGHRDRATAGIQAYAIQQRDTATADALSVRKQRAVETAALNLDPDAVLGSGDLLQAEGTLRGWSPERVSLETQKFQADGLSRVINGYLKADDPARAKALFNENRQVFGTDADKIEEAIANKTADGRAMEMAGEIWTKSGGDPLKAGKLANEVKDPILRKKVESWVADAKEQWAAEQDNTLAAVNIATREARGELDTSSPEYLALDLKRREIAMRNAYTVKVQNRPKTGDTKELRTRSKELATNFIVSDTASQIGIAPEGAAPEEVRAAILGDERYAGADPDAVNAMMKNRAKLIKAKNDGTIVHLEAAKASLEAKMVGTKDKRVRDENLKWFIDQYNALEKPDADKVNALVAKTLNDKVLVEGTLYNSKKRLPQVRPGDKVISPVAPAGLNAAGSLSVDGFKPGAAADVGAEMLKREVERLREKRMAHNAKATAKLPMDEATLRAIAKANLKSKGGK